MPVAGGALLCANFGDPYKAIKHVRTYLTQLPSNINWERLFYLRLEISDCGRKACFLAGTEEIGGIWDFFEERLGEIEDRKLG